MSVGGTPDPTELTTEQLERAIGGLKELMRAEIKAQEDVCTEQFVSVGNQFALVERQRVEQKKDTQDAVTAAFSAAKEAVTKSEGSTKEQLSAMRVEFTTALNGVTALLDDVRTRVGRIESSREGAQAQRTETREGISNAQAVIGIAVAVLASAALYLGLQRNQEPVVVQPTVTVPTPAP